MTRTLADFVYPPLCLHCKTLLNKDESSFCDACTQLLSLINPEERCLSCFSADLSPAHRICGSCRESSPLVHRLAAAFDHAGPAASLVTQMKYGGMPYLAKGAAAFMAVQWSCLRWPLPDVITFVPISRMRRFDRGFNQSELLADELGRILGVPNIDLLKRRSGDFSQAGLGRQGRLSLSPEAFSLKEPVPLQDKIVLLIDDVATTGKTLDSCTAILQSRLPAKIYALTLCRAMK